MIDFHVHAESLNWQDLELMGIAGIKSIIGNSYYPHQTEITTTKYEDLYERLSTFDAWRCSLHGIKLYLAIGINPIAVPKDYEVFLKNLPDYFNQNKRLVAIGEVGIDPRSVTCPDLEVQTKILIEEFKIGKKLNVPLIVHTPPVEVEEKLKEDWKNCSYNNLNDIVDKIISIAKELDMSNIIVDHLSYPELIEKVLSNALNAGITVQPWRKLYPSDVVSILNKVKNFDSKKIFISSDSGPFSSDPLAVPKTARELAKAGFSQEDIDRMLYRNPKELFKI